MSGKLRIDEIFAFVSEDAEGHEGICGFRAPDGSWLPMVGADKERVDTLRPIAKIVSEQTGMRIKLLKFSRRSFIEEI